MCKVGRNCEDYNTKTYSLAENSCASGNSYNNLLLLELIIFW